MGIDLGKRGIAMAIAVVLIMPLALGLMFYPPAHMELKGLPFGVLSLDEGVSQGPVNVNLGDQLASSIESGDIASLLSSSEDGEDVDGSPLADTLSFKAFDSQQQLDQAFADHELYGAFVIPEDFSQARMAQVLAAQAQAGSAMQEALAGQSATAAQGAVDPSALAGSISSETGSSAMTSSAGAMAANATAAAPGVSVTDADATSGDGDVADSSIKIVLDYAKSPLVATQMETALKGALASSGMGVDIEVIDKGPAAEVDSGNIFSGMFSQMMVIMPMLICTMLAGTFAVLGFGVRKGTGMADRSRRFAMAVGLDVVTSFLVSIMGFWIVAVIAGLPVDFIPFMGFAWICSFFLMVFFSGCAAIRGRIAIVMGAIIILLGMTTGYLPYESLPAFWQDWVCPWVPQFYIGNGLRDVIFAGGDIWNGGTVTCLVYAVIGIVLGAIGILIWGRSDRAQAPDPSAAAHAS